ncbi:MAG: hypothetical protein JWR09_3477 [Mucilaginibacter sp.]|nr:hypothetical protein [Mucilaginibacter sp.]
MNFESLSQKLHTRKGFRIGAHLLFWLSELLLSWYTTIISFNAYNNFNDHTIWQLSFINTLNLVLVYYPLVYVILPGFKKGRYVPGILGIVTLLILYSFVNTLSEKELMITCDHCMQQLKANNHDYYQFLQRDLLNRLFAKVASMGMLIGLIFSISVPLVIKVALQSFRQQIAAVKLAKENVELEFNFLKSQVNPHFLFNSLNNIYGLILKNENTKAAGTVARLAEFMRYTLYNSNNDKMSLQKEVQLLKDYIELEQIRLNHTHVEFDIKLDDNAYELPTLLLVPLIENAFKYSADSPGTCIGIQLSTRSGQLHLQVSNTIDENRQLQQTGGIGLQNLKKRLNLYYPEKHEYHYKLTDKDYTATITIEL